MGEQRAWEVLIMGLAILSLGGILYYGWMEATKTTVRIDHTERIEQ